MSVFFYFLDPCKIRCQFDCFCVVPSLNAGYTRLNHAQLGLCNGGGRKFMIDRLISFPSGIGRASICACSAQLKRVRLLTAWRSVMLCVICRFV